MGITPPVTETEFATIKDSVPKLIKALSPFIIADAAYTRGTYGENYSLFYTYTLVSRAESLVIGHIPESIMPILKSLIPADINDGSANDNVAVEADTPIPNTGTLTHEDESEAEYIIPAELIVVISISSLIAIFYLIQNRKRSK